MTQIRKILGLPWFVILICFLPVLHFQASNFRLVPWDAGLALSLLYVLAGVALTAGLRPFTRSLAGAGLAAAPLTAILVWGRFLGPLWSGILFLVGCCGAAAARSRPGWTPTVTLIANAALAALVLQSGLATALQRSGLDDPRPTDLFRTLPDLGGNPAAGELPDIYFIVVDGLGQPALLDRDFGLPVSETTGELGRLGFRFIERSNCNYSQTALALASTLNLAPLQDLLDIRDPAGRNRQVLARLVSDNRLVRALRNRGYRVATLPSGYPVSRLGRPDLRLEPAVRATFTDLYLLNEGILALVAPWLGKAPAVLGHRLHRERVLFNLDHLGRIRNRMPSAEPCFVFTHILAPHPPFVLAADGSPLDPGGALFSFGDGTHWRNAQRPVPADAVREYRRLYAGQARFVLDRLERAVARILATAPRPPIIIVQGDHGPGSRLDWDHPQASDLTERMSIFNAWYLPPGFEHCFPQGTEAVDTFPALLEGLFGSPQSDPAGGITFSTMQAPFTFLETVSGGAE
ncbi:MAG: hypothetical protein ABIK96_00300 [bacterium]